MLKGFDFKHRDDRFDNFKRSDLGDQLDRLLRIAKRLHIPILVLVDGWESSGKGYIINDLTRELDPRDVRVEVFEEKYDIERRHPSAWRYWVRIPSNKEFVVYDRSFYYQVFNQDERTDEMLAKRKKELLDLEEMLIDDGTIVIKYFLNITQETQQERIEKLENSQYRQYLVGEEDYAQQENYEECREWFQRVIEATDTTYSPWNIINAEDRKAASKEVLGRTIELVTAGIEQVTLRRERQSSKTRNYQAGPAQLEALDVNRTISKSDYDDQLDDLQERAAELVYECYVKQIAIVVALEGVDAAGKGGAVKRLTRQIDPRSYNIHNISAPTDEELAHHYLWRFQTRMPQDGYLAIFDRSWYGRVLVERIEELTPEKDWERAYDEINSMEQTLTDHGSIVMKFFLYIDEDEQAERFRDREKEPDKNYKITSEDWRNRKRWDDYILAYEEMLARTNTGRAPWYVVATNTKRLARIEVLQHFIQHIESHLEEHDEGEE